jgi:hypothetical protein
MAYASRDEFHSNWSGGIGGDSFLLSEKPRFPLVNHVGDDISALMNQPSTCALHNFFSDGPSTHVYKPLDLDA